MARKTQRLIAEQRKAREQGRELTRSERRDILDSPLQRARRKAKQFREVTIRPGQTISQIAKDVAGSERAFADILELNPDLITSSGDFFSKPGQTILVPTAEGFDPNRFISNRVVSAVRRSVDDARERDGLAPLQRGPGGEVVLDDRGFAVTGDNAIGDSGLGLDDDGAPSPDGPEGRRFQEGAQGARFNRASGTAIGQTGAAPLAAPSPLDDKLAQAGAQQPSADPTTRRLQEGAVGSRFNRNPGAAIGRSVNVNPNVALSVAAQLQEARSDALLNAPVDADELFSGQSAFSPGGGAGDAGDAAEPFPELGKENVDYFVDFNGNVILASGERVTDPGSSDRINKNTEEAFGYDVLQANKSDLANAARSTAQAIAEAAAADDRSLMPGEMSPEMAGLLAPHYGYDNQTDFMVDLGYLPNKDGTGWEVYDPTDYDNDEGYRARLYKSGYGDYIRRQIRKAERGGAGGRGGYPYNGGGGGGGSSGYYPTGALISFNVGSLLGEE